MSQTDHARRQVNDPFEGRTVTGRKRRWPAIALLVLLVAVVLVGLVGLLRAVRAGEVLPGVAIGGVQVGGLRAQQVERVVERLVRDRQREEVTFTRGDRRFHYRPGPDGYAADVDATVAAAFAPGREGSLVASSWEHIAALWRRPVTIDYPGAAEEEPVETWVAAIGAAFDAAPSAGAIEVDPTTLDVSTEPPQPGERVDQPAARRAALRAVDEPGADELDLPVEVAPTQVDEADVALVAQLAASAVEEPLALTAHGETVLLEPADLARMIVAHEVEGDDGPTLELGVDIEATAAAFAPHLELLNVPATDTTFEVVSDPPTLDEQGDVTWEPVPAELEVIPGEGGLEFDAEAAAPDIAAALNAGRRSMTLQLVPDEPELSAAQAEALGIDHLIGTFTTYHDCCQPRVTNIHLIADIIDGTIILPGEQFSVNGIVGPRTEENGFVEAPAIFQGELRQEVGGGISQFGTTSFNAVFFAGLPLDRWQAHSLYISRYPRGRESTLNFPSIDVAFTNDTGNGIFVDTSYTDTSITVSIYGDNGGREVSAVMGEPFNFSEPETIERTNPDLPPGSTVTVQSGYGGFDVEVIRIIEDGDRTVEEELFTRYYASPRIIEHGPSAPSPSPSPSPSPTPSPTPSPSPTRTRD